MIRQASFPWRKALLVFCISLLACASLFLLFLGITSVAAGFHHPGEPGRLTPLATGAALCIAALWGLVRGSRAIVSALKEKEPAGR